MLLGIKDKRTIYIRHSLVGFISVILTFLIWLTRDGFVENHRLWRAVGDTSFILLFLTLVIGPVAKIWQSAMKMLSWRRELGIWFALTAAIHGFLILNGGMQWNIYILLGYVFVKEQNKWIMLRSSLGIANILGLIALFWSLVLAVTASDKAVNYLGITSWKWLHNLANVVFYTASLHVLSFMFFVYSSSNKPDPFDANNWFRFFSLFMIIALLILQTVAFLKTVKRQKNKNW